MIKEAFLTLIRKYSDNEIYCLECWSEIEKNYSSPSRHYHNLNHLKSMLAELDKVQSQVNRLDALLFSIYYHDIIYNPTKNNNEHQSALLFQKRISETSFERVNESMAQIEATKEHQLSPDNDTNILLDLDLSVLGKSPVEYKRYSEGIRKEYGIYPDAVYRSGRKKVLKNLLEKDSIFKTAFFRKEYESRAKENLEFELKQLGAMK